MSIGERLNDLRLKMKRTLKEQSEVLGVSLNTIYRWEHNLTVPRKSSLTKIASLYNVSLDWLINGNMPEESHKPLSIYPEDDAEHLLIRMFRELSDYNKYRTLGYIERIYIEEINKEKQAHNL